MSEPWPTTTIAPGTPVSAVPFDQLRVGMFVRSARGTEGRISGLHVLTSSQSDDNEIDFIWTNGSASQCVYHFWCDKVTIVGG